MAGSREEVSWGPDGRWGLWIGAGIVDGLIELLDQQLAIPTIVHTPTLKETPVLTGRDLVHDPQPAAVGVVPWLDHDQITDRLQRMQCCVVVDKQIAVTQALAQLDAEGQAFPAEAVAGFSEDMAPVDAEGRPKIIDPGSAWPPRPESIGPVRVWGYRAKGPKPLAHTKLLVLGKTAWFKNSAYPEGGSPEQQIFIPSGVWFGSANWTHRSASQHLEMGAFTTDEAFTRACFETARHQAQDQATRDATC